MTFTPVKRGSILLLSGSKEHLYFICNDPVFYPSLGKDTFLAVNLTSVVPEIKFDTTCVLDRGDHPFIQHPSYIFYQRAEIFGVDTVTQQVISGDIRTHQLCDKTVFRRVLSGFECSEHVKPKIRNYYQKYCVLK